MNCQFFLGTALHSEFWLTFDHYHGILLWIENSPAFACESELDFEKLSDQILEVIT